MLPFDAWMKHGSAKQRQARLQAVSPGGGGGTSSKKAPSVASDSDTQRPSSPSSSSVCSSSRYASANNFTLYQA